LTKQGAHGLTMETWKKVVGAIEDSIPLYDRVNEMISLGQASAARKFAIEQLQLTGESKVLDAGIGPGTTSKLVLESVVPSLLVGLDGSVKQLTTARSNLGTIGANVLHVVCGSFEFLPFRDQTFDSVITCYALRDSFNLTQSIGEYYRVCEERGAFADVDIGKPENFLKRLGSNLYIRYLMPLIAKFVILGKIKGNPWRMIVPTYRTLPTTPTILSMMKEKFQQVQLKEFIMGGVVVIVSRKSKT